MITTLPTLGYNVERRHLREIRKLCKERLFRRSRFVGTLFWVIFFLPLIPALIAVAEVGPAATNAAPFLIGFFYVFILILVAQVLNTAAVNRNWFKLETRCGLNQVSFSEGSIRFETASTRFEYRRAAVDSIEETDSGTGIVCGSFAYVVPDTALTDGIQPAEFRKMLLHWKEST